MKKVDNEKLNSDFYFQLQEKEKFNKKRLNKTKDKIKRERKKNNRYDDYEE